MSRFKTITIFLVVALANPLCCCLGLDGLFAEAIEEKVPVAHGCCSLSGASHDADQDPVETHENCPHELERVSKIVDGDSGLQVAKPLFSVQFVQLGGDTLSSVGKEGLEIQARPPPCMMAGGTLALSKAYCSFLL